MHGITKNNHGTWTMIIPRAFLLLLTVPVIVFSGLPANDNFVNIEKALTVPFKLDRNRVIIPTVVNDSKPLDLILDTGMRFDGVYLFHKELVDEIDTSGAIEVQVGGAGEASTAIMIETGRIKFGGVAIASQRVLISRSPLTQTFPTDGVIGWNFFGHYTVEIDYDREIISLRDTSEVQKDSTWQMIPITLKKDIPFIDGVLEVIDGETVPVSLYIDLASGDALELLTKPDQKFTLPDSLVDNYLGIGLSGDIYGQKGRIKKLSIASFDLLNVLTAFAPAEVRSKQEGADGILGNDCIRRFNVIFDYTHGRLYFKPNSFFNTPFE